MSNQIQTIIRRSTRNDNDPLNILCVPTHERWEQGLAATGHEFWAYRAPNLKDWNTVYAPVPSNYHLLNPIKQQHQIPSYINLDIVLSQSKAGQFPILSQIAKSLGLPLISMEHTLPSIYVTTSQIKQISEFYGDVNVFVSDYNRKAWGYPDDFGRTCHTGIDTDFFQSNNKPKENYVLSINNDWINRDQFCGFNIWAQTVGYPNQPLLPTRVLGDTPGLSQAAQSLEELVDAYSCATVYLNTTLVSSLPTTILEAMACGTPVVSTGTCLIPKIMIKHEHNGFISKNNDPKELRYYCQKLLQDEKLAEEMGKNARNWVLEHFSLDKFVDTWQSIFQEALAVKT